jgi:hypothetical protein
MPKANTWQCTCPCGFTGNSCQTDINECSSNPCNLLVKFFFYFNLKIYIKLGLNGGTCAEPKPCGFVCICLQAPTAYYGTICESKSPIMPQSAPCIYKAIETQYFSGSQLSLLTFNEIIDTIYKAYQTVNQNNVCPLGFTLVAGSCYRLINDYKYDWNQAQGSCSSLNSQLASFNNLTELDLVRSWLNKMVLTRQNIWTDGKLINGKWLWNSNKNTIPSDLLVNVGSNSAIDTLDLSYSNGFSLTNDVPADSPSNYILCKTSIFTFNKNTVSLSLINQTTAITSTGQPILGFTYQVNVTESYNLVSVNQPKTQDYLTLYSYNPIQHGQYYIDQVFPYSQPFSLTLCNAIPGGQVAQIQSIIYNNWISLVPSFATCNCFNVFIISATPYVDVNNSTSTMISFVGKADSIVYDATSSGTIPAIKDIQKLLASNGYSACVPRVPRSATLELATSVYIPSDSIINGINAVRPDLVGKVQVAPLSKTNGISTIINKAVSLSSFDVLIDGKSLNFLTQTDINPNSLIQQLNYQNPGVVVTLSTGVYSRSYFFTLFSNNEISEQQYSQLIASINSVFLKNYPQFTSNKVVVTIPLQEQYIDLNLNLFFGLNILITIDQQLADDVLNIDRSIFNQLQSLQTNTIVYSFFTPTGYVLPLSESITFFSNMAITQDNIPKLQTLIKNMFETTFPTYANQLSIIMALQQPFSQKDGTIYWKIFIIPNIINTANVLSLTSDINVFVSSLSSAINFVHPSGNSYKFFYNIQNIYDLSTQFSVVIKGMVAGYDRDIIRNSISSTWNLTAGQNVQLSAQWIKGMYQIVFIDTYNILLDQNNDVYTEYLYFVTQNNAAVAQDHFPILPNYQWIQISVTKNNLSYTLVDPNNSNLNDYTSFYSVDFLGYIDFTYYNDISNIIKTEFSKYYNGKNIR